jgi:hypothetical protein
MPDLQLHDSVLGSDFPLLSRRNFAAVLKPKRDKEHGMEITEALVLRGLRETIRPGSAPCCSRPG